MDKQYKPIINILGCCVSRDIFSYQKDDGNYCISKYVNEFDMLSICDQPLDVDKQKYDELDISDLMHNFTKRSFYFDMTKNVLSYIKEQSADYLIIDSGLTRFKRFKIGDSYIVSTPIRKKVLQRLYENDVISFCADDEMFASPAEMSEKLQLFAEEIKKLYKPEQIILVDIVSAFFHDDGKHIEPFRNSSRWVEQNQRMRMGFSILKNAFTGCHVIPMPESVVADTNHRLKLAVLHYTKEYYEYAYQCVEVIVKRLPLIEEQKSIEKLYQECLKYYYEKYYLQLEIELSDRNSLLLNEMRISKSRDLQAKFFRSMLLKNIDLKMFFDKKNHKTVIIYGWTRVSEFLVEELNRINIDIICVIENLPYGHIGGHIISGGVKIVKRSAKEIPDADCIIIADLLNKDQILEILNKLTTIPVYTDEDILNS